MVPPSPSHAGKPSVQRLVFVRHANAAPRDAEATAREFGLEVAELPAHAK